MFKYDHIISKFAMIELPPAAQYPFIVKEKTYGAVFCIVNFRLFAQIVCKLYHKYII